jgi:hypothetical protein
MVGCSDCQTLRVPLEFCETLTEEEDALTREMVPCISDN